MWCCHEEETPSQVRHVPGESLSCAATMMGSGGRFYIFPPRFLTAMSSPEGYLFLCMYTLHMNRDQHCAHGVPRQEPRTPLPTLGYTSTPVTGHGCARMRMRMDEDENEDEEGAAPREGRLLSAADTQHPTPQPEMQESGFIYIPHKQLLQVILNHK